MVLCCRCKKRPAVVFVTSMRGQEKRNEGFCLACAREMNIPQVSEYMEHMGLSEEELEQMSEQMMELMDGDGFEMGGASTVPPFIRRLFRQESPSSDDSEPEQEGNAGKGATPNPFQDQVPPRPRLKERRFLKTYCTDLTMRAANGELDAVVGREREIARVIQILSRRQKNNPCLIGEPGVGKTAIAEGIAQKIIRGEVPMQLRFKRVMLLDLTALVAGTQFRGQFESRMKGLIEEVKEEKEIILFVDEIHNLVGAGDAEGSMNAANILKPALSRGEVQVIGATTFAEYRKFIEKDGALERRFQPVRVDEPTVEETVSILQGLACYYEAYHHVKIPPIALRMCAELSERYITDRFLPDKAIDLLDEACAYSNICHPELAEAEDLRAEVQDLVEAITGFEEEQRNDPNPDYETLAKQKTFLIHKQQEAEAARKRVEHIVLERSDLAHVIEVWTGIPSNKIEETEYEKLLLLEEHLRAHIIGQEPAIQALTAAIKRTRVQLTKRRRPASFIFVGPTGVGKTELARVLSEELFDSVEPMIRLDMTEYMEKHSISRLIGSPPGYVGYEEAGQLTEKVRRRPYSLILFDEIEKAHPDVMNLLLQILDEGAIDDAQGRRVNFENTIIIMTSNAGSTDTSTGMGFNRTAEDISRERAMKGLRDFLRPEFIGRIDEIIVFQPLSRENFAQIAALMLSETAEALKEQNIALDWEDAALSYIAEQAYGKRYGARDIRRVLREEVENRIAMLILESRTAPEKLHIGVAANGAGIELQRTGGDL